MPSSFRGKEHRFNTNLLMTTCDTNFRNHTMLCGVDLEMPVCVWAGTHNDGQCVWEATLRLPDKREEACQKTRQARTHTHTLLNSCFPPHPPIIGAPLLLANPPDSPAKLTAPSSVENESRLHYNRAGQIPLALSEIERREWRAGGGGGGACPLSEEEGEFRRRH